jgi:16S rRNA (guanine966-N2)-methyltransferase
MRIIKGKHANRQLTSPGRGVRPTAETARDRILDLLAEDLTGARVLDLFAGSGALGLEAISRGAKYADFVENGRSALHSLKANVAALREQRRCRIYKRDAIPFTEALEAGAYDIAFADPPYGSRKLDRVLAHWQSSKFAAILVLEHRNDHAIGTNRKKQYDFEGETRVTILRGTGPATSRRAGVAPKTSVSKP